MSNRKSAEERLKVYFESTYESQDPDAEGRAFLSGYHEGIRACIEELRSHEVMAQHAMNNIRSNGLGSRPYEFADWLEKHLLQDRRGTTVCAHNTPSDQKCPLC